MGLFKKKEKRSAETGEAYFNDSLLTAIIGGGSTVTKEQALQIPTIAACVNLIADRISALPIKLYREEGSEVVEVKDDNRLRLLNHDTGDTINASEMKRLWVRDYFLGKGSYTYIERNIVNEPIGLFAVDEARVAVKTNNDPIHKNYSINVNGKTYFPFQFLKILRNSKGYGTGTSIIKENPLSLAIYYNTMKFENANIRKGGNKRGFLKAASTVGKDEMNTLKESWRQLYSNSDDTKDNIVVLNNGLEFQEASSTSVELQLNENKKSNSIELCKLFCMPADVLCGRADDSTVSQLVQNCLMPPINAIEAALDHDLLTEAEKAGNWYFVFDTTELTRGDFTNRMNGYAVALQNNIYQLDEIREKEDLPPLGFNYIKLGLQDVLLDPKTMQIYTPNTKELVSLDGGEISIGKSDDSIIENRGNPYHDEKGRFASKNGMINTTANTTENTLIDTDVNGLTKTPNSGKIDIEIDELTSCLRNNETGALVNTTIEQVRPKKNEYSDWEFDWTKPEKSGYSVYALKAEGDKRAQGLIAFKEDKNSWAIDIDIVEAAPHNNTHNKRNNGKKEYNGVGGHLFAEACRYSVEKGYGGYVFFESKSNLFEHYSKTLGAIRIGNSQRMVINEKAAQKLINRYYKE